MYSAGDLIIFKINDIEFYGEILGVVDQKKLEISRLKNTLKQENRIWEFVADADTTFKTGNNSDASPTGMQYDLLPFSPEMNSYGLEKPTYEKDFIYDQWGVTISGGAPIYNIDGTGVAVIGVDMDVSDVYIEVNNRFKSYIWFWSIFTLLLIFRLCLLQKAPLAHGRL